MERKDMDNIVSASEWKGYCESLINENTALHFRVARLEDALKEIGYYADGMNWKSIARRALEEK